MVTVAEKGDAFSGTVDCMGSFHLAPRMCRCQLSGAHTGSQRGNPSGWDYLTGMHVPA